MRKLAVLAAAAAIAPVAALATSGVANASINTSCDTTDNQCFVSEDMGNGNCNAVIWQTNSASDQDPSGTFAQAEIANYDTGYACDAWVERDVNNSGWYRISGVYDLPASGANDLTGNYYNGGGYQARVCFQFDWGSSLGAVHCSGAITYKG